MIRWSETFLLPTLGVGHVTVGTGNAGLPVNAVVGKHFKFGMADKAHFETGHGLGPFAVGLVAANFLDDVFNRDVAHFASFPGEENIFGFHVIRFLYDVTDMTLGADQSPFVLIGQRGLVNTKRLQGLSPM